MNFNLKEITWQDAEKLEPGSKLFVGQTREKAVEGEWSSTGWRDRGGYWWEVSGLTTLNLTPYVPAPDAVDISPSEAAARMVDGLPVEARWKEGAPELVVNTPVWSVEDITDPRRTFQIPACPEPKQRLVIEVAAGVEVPPEFEIIDALLIRRRDSLGLATVVSREEVE